MSFRRLSERVEGKSRPPWSRWKVVPQSRTGGKETPITEFVMCSRLEQLPHVIGVGPAQWATTNVRQKATVVCEVRGSRSYKRLMRELECERCWGLKVASICYSIYWTT